MSKHRTVVVTGFGPFGCHEINASWEVAKELKKLGLESWNIDLITQEIPVSYECVIREVPLIWKEYDPELVVHIGVSGLATEIVLERIAHRCGYCKPDIDGKCPKNGCCSGSEESIQTELNLEEICDRIKLTPDLLPQLSVSTNAGRYVCEFIYYTSLNIDNSRTVFVHVPVIDSPYSVREMAKCVKYIIFYLMEQLERSIGILSKNEDDLETLDAKENVILENSPAFLSHNDKQSDISKVITSSSDAALMSEKASVLRGSEKTDRNLVNYVGTKSGTSANTDRPKILSTENGIQNLADVIYKAHDLDTGRGSEKVVDESSEVSARSNVEDSDINERVSIASGTGVKDEKAYGNSSAKTSQRGSIESNATNEFERKSTPEESGMVSVVSNAKDEDTSDNVRNSSMSKKGSDVGGSDGFQATSSGIIRASVSRGSIGSGSQYKANSRPGSSSQESVKSVVSKTSAADDSGGKFSNSAGEKSRSRKLST